MKKLLIFLTIFTLLAGFSVVPADAAVRHYVAKVYKQTTERADQLTEITSGITYQVLATDADTAETLYSDSALTSKTNPVTTTVFNTQDRVDFYCDPTDSGDLQVDLIVVDTAGGFTAFVEDFDPYTHTIIIDERPNIQHHGMIWFGASDNTETDTGVDFAADTAVQRVIVEVVTVDATETIDIGLLSTETAGDPNGFVAGASVATAGFISNGKPTITASGTETYVSTASVVGALMGSSLAGADTATDEGSHYLWDHIVTGSNATSITYTGSADSDTAAGYIHYFFVRMR